MRYFFTLFLLWLALPASLFAAEVITDFTVSYTINADASVDVVERITYDFGNAERHGIFRELSTKHAQPATTWYKNRSVEIRVDSVTRDGSAEPYEERLEGNVLTVRIGDATATIAGQHTYTLKYHLTGALSHGPDGTEFYWNVTGNGWSIPIAEAVATVSSPVQVLLPAHACYTGGAGATSPCAIGATDDGGVTFTARSLAPGEELTIAQALRADTVAYLVVEHVMVWLWFVPLVLGFIGGVWYWLYRTFTLHKSARSVVAQYEPYPGTLPMYTGVLVDGSLDPRDLTAGLLYLAEQGFITIRKTERKALLVFGVDDYEVTLSKPLSAAVTEFQKTALSLLFPTLEVGSTEVLSTLKSSTARQRNNYNLLQSLRQAIRTDLVAQGFYEPVFGFMRRRTARGYEAQNHLQGFKEFLSVTDKARFAFHNAPAKNPKTFMQYLPYAVALGVEQEWAAVFKDVTIPTPQWYEGGQTAFSATALTSDLAAFSTAFASSSGTSGSSGGGSAGGGGGGGGGGSW